MLRLTRRDITAAYSGSVAGSLWVVIDPLVYVVLTLVFFQFAIKGGATGGVPYVAWVMPVIIFWTFINTVLNSSIGSVREYSYLMRHRSFDMRLVAVIKILSGSFVHVILMAIVLLALALLLHVRVSWLTLGVVYFYFAMCCLLVAMGWLLSALGTFWKDMRNLVSIFLQVEFWVSPVFWEPERFPKPVALLMYLNPLYYPIHGYRASVLSMDFGAHFWLITLYFWALVAFLLWFGSRVFTRLSKSFGDVL
ncbi:ABC transporter permease [Burkholderia sp. lig30]|uniref:ABC transporter permease n=1 Tax=Burkholderia sp. lig30 TaxID=1192124 RepID=UPI0013656BDB|nr:ABC transporter permease [Burkholderia sp. lig30]